MIGARIGFFPVHARESRPRYVPARGIADYIPRFCPCIVDHSLVRGQKEKEKIHAKNADFNVSGRKTCAITSPSSEKAERLYGLIGVYEYFLIGIRCCVSI